MPEFKHHDLPVRELTCGWHNAATRTSCGVQATTVVKSRKWRYMALCARHAQLWNREKAAERVAAHPRRENAR